LNFKSDALVLLGALIGGLAGYFLFHFLINQGFYGLMLPGGVLGIGAGVFKTPNKYVSVVCGVMAAALGLVAEWSAFPFKADESLAYFLSHFYDLKPATLIMIAIGAGVGFWIPFRKSQDAIEILKPS